MHMIVTFTNHETEFFVTDKSQSIHKNCVMTTTIKFLEILRYGEVIIQLKPSLGEVTLLIQCLVFKFYTIT